MFPILVYNSTPTEYINWSNFDLNYLASYLSKSEIDEGMFSQAFRDQAAHDDKECLRQARQDGVLNVTSMIV